jgi:hypothetical protein
MQGTARRKQPWKTQNWAGHIWKLCVFHTAAAMGFYNKFLKFLGIFLV